MWAPTQGEESSTRWESPNYDKYSHLHPAKPSPEHLWTVGVLAGLEVAKPVLADGCSAWLPCALHKAGPQWLLACCEAQVSVRASRSAGETQASSVIDISLSHSSFSTLLARFSSPGFCREVVCQAPSGAGDDTEWGYLQYLPEFSQAAVQCPWLNSLSHLKGFVAPWGEAKACRWAAKPCFCLPPPFVPTCTNKKDKGWGVNDLLDARNECVPLPGKPSFPAGGKALVWTSRYLVAFPSAWV